MIIKNISTEIIKIPLKTPFITALRKVTNVEFVRVKIACKNNILSYGEAPATKAITGEDLESIIKTIEESKKLFFEKSPQICLEILDKLKIGSSAKAALNMAFYNLVIPMNYEKNSKIKTAITISLNEKQKMCDDAILAKRDGLNILKLKFGDDILHAIDLTKTIKKLNPNAKILIDANQAWDVQKSKKFLDAIKDVDVELLEQPVVAHDILGLKEITQYSHIPIVADEACFTLEDIKKVIKSKSADIINIKLMKCGGITYAIEILDYCRKKNVPVMFGSMLEGPISINYACWLVSKYVDIVKYIDLDSPLLYKNYSKTI